MRSTPDVLKVILPQCLSKTGQMEFVSPTPQLRSCSSKIIRIAVRNRQFAKTLWHRRSCRVAGIAIKMLNTNRIYVILMISASQCSARLIMLAKQRQTSIMAWLERISTSGMVLVEKSIDVI